MSNSKIPCHFAGVKQPKNLATKDPSKKDCRCFPDNRPGHEPIVLIPPIVAPACTQTLTTFGKTNQARQGKCTIYNSPVGYTHQTAMLR